MALELVTCWLLHFTLTICSPLHAQPISDNDRSAVGMCQQSNCVPASGRGLLQTHRHVTTHEEYAATKIEQVAIKGKLHQAKKLHQDFEGGADGQSRKYARLEQQVSQAGGDGVAVVIPGLGNERRALQVEKNIAWLKRQGVPFECRIFVYRSQKDFPLNASRFEPCQLIRHAGHWMGHILAFPLNMTTKPWILHMMDSIEPQADVKLKEIYRIMRANELGHAAPTFNVEGSDLLGISGKPSVYSLMGRNKFFDIGRFTDFIELHFDVFSRRYFACLQDNVDLDNTLGWGVDRLLPSLCGGAAFGSALNAGSLGLLDNMTMVKKFNGSYNYDIANQQMLAYQLKHADAKQPFYTVLGALEAS